MSSRAEQKAEARARREAAERAAAAADRRRRLGIFGAILAVAAVVVVAAVLVSRSGGADAPPSGERLAALDGVPQQGAWLGRPDAPVVVEEYADLQCPFCARFSTEQLDDFVGDEVRGGQVRFRARIMTFLGEDSVTAGRMAVAAGLQNRMWQFTEAFYAKQGEENSGYVTEGFLREVAEDAGLDVDRALADRAKPEVAEQLRETAQAATRNGVSSTPTFLVGRRGGEMTPVTADGLQDAIDEALGR